MVNPTKNLLVFTILMLFGYSSLFSRSLDDTLIKQKTEWLVSYLGHVIWFESKLTGKETDNVFFTRGKVYKDGLVIDYLADAIKAGSIGKCYLIKSLTNIDTASKKGEYIFEEEICILPVVVILKSQIITEISDFTEMSFKKMGAIIKIEFGTSANYYIQEIQPLRISDKKKFSKLE